MEAKSSAERLRTVCVKPCSVKYSAMMAALLPLIYPTTQAMADDDMMAVSTVVEKDEQTNEYRYLATMNTIVVTAPLAQEKGTQHIDNEDIRNRPTRNGTISELLTDNVNVQFANSYNNSETAGEIAPANVSIHGERFYNNNWMIDGISNNDITNPGSNGGELGNDPEGYSPWDLPGGGTQSFWVNSDIIESADVYDSNISAKYGEFTGGVIDAKLKDPDPREASGSISYRTTRDDWTKFHVYGETAEEQAENEEDFEAAESFYYQPQFTKNIYSLNLNQPVSDKTALLFSYNRTESEIPYHHAYMDKWEDQERLSETYVLKALHQADNGDDFKLTAMYSPHEAKYYKKNIENGAFTNEGGGYRINGEWLHYFDGGEVTSYLGYKNTQNEIDHEGDAYYNWRKTDSLDWCSNSSCSFAQAGGYGNFETGNEVITVKQDYEFDTVDWGSTEHEFSLGIQADWGIVKSL